MEAGIVGLPNVGKSTLFNVLTSSQGAESANYPFCTIEPNSGVVPMPDPRLDRIAAIVSPQKVIPTSMEFVDIAGLVEGASKGASKGVSKGLRKGLRRRLRRGIERSLDGSFEGNFEAYV